MTDLLSAVTTDVFAIGDMDTVLHGSGGETQSTPTPQIRQGQFQLWSGSPRSKGMCANPAHGSDTSKTPSAAALSPTHGSMAVFP